MARRYRAYRSENKLSRYSPGEHAAACRGYPESRVCRNQQTGNYHPMLKCSCGVFSRLAVNGYPTWAGAQADALAMERIYLAKLKTEPVSYLSANPQDGA